MSYLNPKLSQTGIKLTPFYAREEEGQSLLM
jgi:hypothetical protein